MTTLSQDTYASLTTPLTIIGSGGGTNSTFSTINVTEQANILNADIFFLSTQIMEAEEAFISSISTLGIYLDGNLLTSAGGGSTSELLLNGVPIATTSNLSSLTEWSWEPAISTVNMDNNNIIAALQVDASTFQSEHVSTISLDVSTINGLPYGAITNIFSTISVSSLTDVSTINGTPLSAFNSNMFSTISVSSLTDVSTINGLPYGATTNKYSTISVSSLTDVSTINGAPLTTFQNSNTFSTISVSSLTNVSTINGAPLTTFQNSNKFSTISVSSLTDVSTINNSTYYSTREWARFFPGNNVNLGTSSINISPTALGYVNSYLDTNLFIGRKDYLLFPDVIIYPATFQVGDLGSPANDFSVACLNTIQLTALLGVEIAGAFGVTVTGGGGVTVQGGGEVSIVGGGGLVLTGGGGILALGGTITLGAGEISVLGGLLNLGSGSIQIGSGLLNILSGNIAIASGAIEMGTGAIVLGTGTTPGGGMDIYGGNLTFYSAAGNSASIIMLEGGAISTNYINSIDTDGNLAITGLSSINGIPYVPNAGNISSLANWADFPAVSTIDVDGYDVTRAVNVSTIDVHASSITTDNIISASPLGNLAITGLSSINGFPYITAAPSSISSIVEWAYFPAVSTIDADGNDIVNLGIVSSITVTAPYILTSAVVGNSTLEISGLTAINGVPYIPAAEPTTWAQYPANSTVQLQGNAIIGASNVSTTSLTVNTINALNEVLSGAMSASTFYGSTMFMDKASFNVLNINNLLSTIAISASTVATANLLADNISSQSIVTDTIKFTTATGAGANIDGVSISSQTVTATNIFADNVSAQLISTATLHFNSELYGPAANIGGVSISSQAVTASDLITSSLISQTGLFTPPGGGPGLTLITGQNIQTSSLVYTGGVVGPAASISSMNLSTINGLPYSAAVPPTNWAIFPATSSINMANYDMKMGGTLQAQNISTLAVNTQTLTVSTLNGLPYLTPAAWSVYPASTNVSMNNFNLTGASTLQGQQVNTTGMSSFTGSFTDSVIVGQSLNVKSYLGVSSYATVGSSLTVNTYANIGSFLTASTFFTNTISTASVTTSTLNTNTISTAIATASTLNTNTISTNAISTNVISATGLSVININGAPYAPGTTVSSLSSWAIFPANSTVQASTAIISSLTVGGAGIFVKGRSGVPTGVIPGGGIFLQEDTEGGSGNIYFPTAGHSTLSTDILSLQGYSVWNPNQTSTINALQLDSYTGSIANLQPIACSQILLNSVGTSPLSSLYATVSIGADPATASVLFPYSSIRGISTVNGQAYGTTWALYPAISTVQASTALISSLTVGGAGIFVQGGVVSATDSIPKNGIFLQEDNAPAGGEGGSGNIYFPTPGHSTLATGIIKLQGYSVWNPNETSTINALQLSNYTSGLDSLQPIACSQILLNSIGANPASSFFATVSIGADPATASVLFPYSSIRGISTVNGNPLPWISTLGGGSFNSTVSGASAATPILLYSSLTFPYPGQYNIYQKGCLVKTGGGGGEVHASIVYSRSSTLSFADNQQGLSAAPFVNNIGVSSFTTFTTSLYVSSTALTKNIYYYDPGAANYTVNIITNAPVVQYIPPPS